MGKAAKKIGRFFKNIGQKIGDLAEDVVDFAGDAIEFVVDDVVGGMAEGVTRAVAGDAAAEKVGKKFEKAGDKIDNFIDDRIAPAVGRSIKGAVDILNPVVHISNIVERGLIDGITHTFVEGGQDMIAGTARIIGGEKGEQKFDKFFDEKVQHWVELGISTIGSAALMFVPGGAAILAADAASMLATTGIRAAKGEEVTGLDWGLAGAGAAMSLIPAAGQLGKVAMGAKKVADVAEDSVTVGAKVAGATGDATKATIKASKVADDTAQLTKDTLKASDNVANIVQPYDGKTGSARIFTQQGAQEIAKDSAFDIATSVAIMKGLEYFQENIDPQRMPVSQAIKGQEGAVFQPHFTAPMA